MWTVRRIQSTIVDTAVAAMVTLIFCLPSRVIVDWLTWPMVAEKAVNTTHRCIRSETSFAKNVRYNFARNRGCLYCVVVGQITMLATTMNPEAELNTMVNELVGSSAADHQSRGCNGFEPVKCGVDTGGRSVYLSIVPRRVRRRVFSYTHQRTVRPALVGGALTSRAVRHVI